MPCNSLRTVVLVSKQNESFGYYQGCKFCLNMRLKLFQIIDFDQITEYERLKEKFVGIAHFYLNQYGEQSISNNIDIEIYTKLVELDASLRTTAFEHLYWRLNKTTRSDIIKVASFL